MLPYSSNHIGLPEIVSLGWLIYVLLRISLFFAKGDIYFIDMQKNWTSSLHSKANFYNGVQEGLN